MSLLMSLIDHFSRITFRTLKGTTFLLFTEIIKLMHSFQSAVEVFLNLSQFCYFYCKCAGAKDVKTSPSADLDLQSVFRSIFHLSEAFHKCFSANGNKLKCVWQLQTMKSSAAADFSQLTSLLVVHTSAFSPRTSTPFAEEMWCMWTRGARLRSARLLLTRLMWCE